MALFDSFVVAADGKRPIGTDFTWNVDFDPNLTGEDGGLYFGGANATVADGGQFVPLYTPKPWNSGSSMAHLDDETFTGPYVKMMNARMPMGLKIRVLSPIELGILKDLGLPRGGSLGIRRRDGDDHGWRQACRWLPSEPPTETARMSR